MNKEQTKNIVDEVREIRERHAVESFDRDYAYLKEQDPDLYNKLFAELFPEKPVDKVA